MYGAINELETDSRNKKMVDVTSGVNKFMKEVKNEICDVLTNDHIILNR
jgi:hypothetical protein